MDTLIRRNSPELKTQNSGVFDFPYNPKKDKGKTPG
jgi:hypothetical protein